MSIKINGRDLSKRMINGREVIKVMKNGVQVRPSAVPPVFDNYLCFTATKSGTYFKLSWNNNIEISSDKNTWTDYTAGDNITLANIWDKVYLRNKSTSVATYAWQFYTSTNAEFEVSWNVTTLLSKYGTDTLLYAGSGNYWCFEWTFHQCSILTPPELPATTLAEKCYQGMFYQSSILTAPTLPATTLAGNCYFEMFELCQRLTNAPQLPATTLATNCYYRMFRDCSNLTTAPSLPATTLAKRCYYMMFYDCDSLTQIPELPATTLPDECYYRMFRESYGIKIYRTQDSSHPNEYRIPKSWTGIVGTDSITGMFTNTWGEVTGTPTIDRTYYTSNTIV